MECTLLAQMSISGAPAERVESPFGKQGGDLLAAVFLISAIAFGLVSLTYPFGRDQGLYFYVAREWVKHGSIPYRDVLDHKTPGIYFVHALAILLFGETMWGIRVLELFAVVACGAAAAAIASPSDVPLKRPVLAGGSLAMSMIYFGALDYWATAQSEIWYSLFAFVAIAIARHAPSSTRSIVLSGMFGGMALIMKPPAIWFVVVAWVVMLHRRPRKWRDLLFSTLRFAAGGAIVPALVVTYFAAHHALAAMIDVVVGANGYYVSHEAGAARPLEAIIAGFRHFSPLSAVLPFAALASFIIARKEKNREVMERCALCLSLILAGFLATAMQGKFYLLHQASMVAPLTTLTVLFVLGAREVLRDRFGGPLAGSFLLMLFGISWWTGDGISTWFGAVTNAIALRQGKITQDEWNRSFSREFYLFHYEKSVELANWLAAHTTPEDSITVRGFEPQIYALAKRRHVGRFFWTTFIVNPDRAYRRAEWLAEDLNDLKTHPPKYIASFEWVTEGPDSKKWAEDLGYHQVAVVGGMAIMERNP